LRIRLRLEHLEPRQLLSGYAPTDVEQLFLERLNDARANPAAYGAAIGVDLSGVAPAQPLTFDTRLIQSARDHSQDMNDNAYVSHTGSDGSSPGQRMSAAGFPWLSQAESIAVGYTTTDEALRALITDAGFPDLGHRNHLLGIGSSLAAHQELGIGIVQGSGPYHYYYTIDSGYTADPRPFLTGVIYKDLNNNGKYDPGEGLGGVTITVSGVGTTTTFSTGGYSLQLDPGTYTVTASGGGLSGPVSRSVTVGSTNYRLTILDNGSIQDHPPALEAIPDQSMAQSAGSFVYTLSATDPDGDALTFSASAVSQAYTLRQTYGLSGGGDDYFNWGGRGEKWLTGAGGSWFFILPSGELYQWDGGNGATGTLVAPLETAYYADPSLLYNATVGATASVTGNLLTVTPVAGFVGKLMVTVTVSDGQLTDTKAFTLTVT
jgi:uncharacterized protein YkwD